jgi:hypothetical protein
MVNDGWWTGIPLTPINAIIRLRFAADSSDQTFDIPKCESMTLKAARRIFMMWDMIGHNHGTIANISQPFKDCHKIHVAVVRINFLKIVPSTLDIPQVNVKYLVTLSNPFYYW